MSTYRKLSACAPLVMAAATTLVMVDRTWAQTTDTGSLPKWQLKSGITGLSRPSLTVNSDIEDSFMQSWTSPRLLRQDGSDGGPDLSKFRYPDTASLPAPWSIKCDPKKDGVHTAAKWREFDNYYPDRPEGYYAVCEIPSCQVRALANGFKTPTYQWTITGGTPMGDAANYTQDSSSIHIGQDAYTGVGIYLGDEQFKLSDYFSKFHVKVTETDTGSPIFSLSSTYKVTWHLFYEWYRDTSLPSTTTWAWNYNVSDWSSWSALDPIPVHTKDIQQWAVLNFLNKSVQVALDGTVAYVGDGGAPAGFANPDIAGACLMLYVDGVIAREAAPPPPQDTNLTPTHADWKQAIEMEQSLNQQRLLGNTPTMYDPVFEMTKDEVDAAVLDAQQANVSDDALWNDNKLECKVYVAQKEQVNPMIGDRYDEHGYIDRVPGTEHKTGRPYPVYVFRLKSRPHEPPAPTSGNDPLIYNDAN